MDGEGGRSRGDRHESPPHPSARARGHACLVLSLIVLVWNLAVTARDSLWPRASRAAGSGQVGTIAQFVAQDAVGGGASGVAPTGGRTGPLSVRQRFLLGRRVDVNKAGWEEISGLPGISDAVAQAVVEKRGRTGPFRRPEDLLGVRGIKEKRLKKILPFLSEFNNN